MTLGRTSYVLASAIALTATLASSAAAQPSEAERLFREGRRLLKVGSVAEACERFAASDAIESRVGTLLNLGDCRERNNELASAWAAFTKAADEAKLAQNDPDREQEAMRRASALVPHLSHLTLLVPTATQLDGLQITRAGHVVEAAEWNAEVPVDGGTFLVTAKAPGHDTWVARVHVETEADKVSLEIPTLEATNAPAPAPSLIEAEDANAPVIPARSRMTGMRWTAVGVGIAGLAGLGVGIVRGIQSRDLQQRSDELCPNTTCGVPEGLALNREARTASLQANVLFATSAVLVIGAGALWYFGAPHHHETKKPTLSITPQVGPIGASLSLTGSF